MTIGAIPQARRRPRRDRQEPARDRGWRLAFRAALALGFSALLLPAGTVADEAIGILGRERATRTFALRQDGAEPLPIPSRPHGLVIDGLEHAGCGAETTQSPKSPAPAIDMPGAIFMRPLGLAFWCLIALLGLAGACGDLITRQPRVERWLFAVGIVFAGAGGYGIGVCLPRPLMLATAPQDAGASMSCSKMLEMPPADKSGAGSSPDGALPASNKTWTASSFIKLY